MSTIFVGVIVVAIVGNAAEHSTAVLVAMKNRMDLSLSHRDRQQHPDRAVRRAGARVAELRYRTAPYGSGVHSGGGARCRVEPWRSQARSRVTASRTGLKACSCWRST